jgi:hypothetical protein
MPKLYAFYFLIKTVGFSPNGRERAGLGQHITQAVNRAMPLTSSISRGKKRTFVKLLCLGNRVCYLSNRVCNAI